MTLEKEDYKEEQRNKVLAGALECFAQKGYEGATIDDIVNESGVSKGSIYKLFKSKEEIYFQLMSQNSKELMDEINAVISKHTSALDKLTALFTEYLGREVNSKVFKSFLVQSEFELFSSRREDLRELLEERRRAKVNIISDVIHEGINNGEFRKEIDITVHADIFWSYMHGNITHKILYPDLPYQELVNGQKESFLKKIRK
ncbi:TetR/AcrR family transcriptional regulator [Robertmurraya andreesenii]|uniref:AcrR family transcriptional regulator n=1 Tax=Anoxybacillus andreesenii TaxID=1325932 RepID=A0ABT9V9W1_9BACL|nr:TetR/AcrR family transcriptional regulator [Robertmurraya andreesenii]MDQ0157746.1 AcrR family transcriptional regulator [Robertmurraya andreesenii]